MKKYSIYAFAIASSMVFSGCCSPILDATDEGISNVVSKPQATSYDIYTVDEYSDFINNTAYESRANWNLANVHDPSVVKADDGYYYMFQTDASYGNAHDGHGHFFCRRSKDLITWDFLGSTYSVTSRPVNPEQEGTYNEVNTWWVKNKLNSLRQQMDEDLVAAGKTAIGPTTVNFPAAMKLNSSFGYWAPCVRKVPGTNTYRMYYVITIPGNINGDKTWSERCFIGLQETDNIADVTSWVDKGYVLTNYSDRNLDFNYASTDYTHCYFKYNAIDPSYIILENGEHWLIYGSWHNGFAAVQIDPASGKPINNIDGSVKPWGNTEAAFGKKIYSRQSGSYPSWARWQASEAPEVIYHDGYYYLFLANDQLEFKYNTSVVRSTSIDGTYYDITGTPYTNGQSSGYAYPTLTHPYKFGNDHGWVGISHCAVFDDGQGNWYYCSQQRFPSGYSGNNSSNAVMFGGVRAIMWTENGWPLVSPERYAGVEQTAITESELTGKWENISLSYDKNKENDNSTIIGSVDIKLGTDHKVTGSPFAGQTWSFDASKNILTVGGIKLYLRRDLDWEKAAGSRTSTIVYAGFSSDGKKTYWGKKVTETTPE